MSKKTLSLWILTACACNGQSGGDRGAPAVPRDFGAEAGELLIEEGSDHAPGNGAVHAYTRLIYVAVVLDGYAYRYRAGIDDLGRRIETHRPHVVDRRHGRQLRDRVVADVLIARQDGLDLDRQGSRRGRP